MSYPLGTFARSAPDGPRCSHDRDEPGRKFDSTDEASSLANFCLLSFPLSFLQPFVRLGFPCCVGLL